MSKPPILLEVCNCVIGRISEVLAPWRVATHNAPLVEYSTSSLCYSINDLTTATTAYVPAIMPVVALHQLFLGSSEELSEDVSPHGKRMSKEKEIEWDC